MKTIIRHCHIGKHFSIVLGCFILVLYCMSCKNCDALPITGNSFWADTIDGNCNLIQAGYFSEVWIPPKSRGLELKLQFPCLLGTPTVDPYWDNVLQYNHFSNGNTLTLKVLQNYSNSVVDTITLAFPDTSFIFKVKFLPVPTNPAAGGYLVPVIPGDCNADGAVNILDFAPIMFAMSGLPPVAVHLPQNNFDSSANAINWVRPWEETWKWGGNINERIDYVHADCNGDGVINLDDAEIVKEYLQPMDIPLFLRDGTSNLKFTAIFKSGEENWLQEIGNQPERVQLPFDIRLAGGGVQDVLGFVFSRPLISGQSATVHNLDISFQNSELIDTIPGEVAVPYFAHHKLWEADIMNDFAGTCKETSDSIPIADVCLFRIGGPKDLGTEASTNSCTVTIGDPDATVPIIQYVFDGLAFVSGPNGIEVVPSHCSQSTFMLDTANYCHDSTNWVIRDHIEDYGSENGLYPLPATRSPDIWTDSKMTALPVPTSRTAWVPDTLTGGDTLNFYIRIANESCNPIDSVHLSDCQLYWVDSLSVRVIDSLSTQGYQISPLSFVPVGAWSILSKSNETFILEGVVPSLPTPVPTHITLVALLNPLGDAPNISPGQTVIEAISLSNNIAGRTYAYKN